MLGEYERDYKIYPGGRVVPDERFYDTDLDQKSIDVPNIIKALNEFAKKGFFNVNILGHQAPSFFSEPINISPQTRIIPAQGTRKLFLAVLKPREFLRISTLWWIPTSLMARNDVKISLFVGAKEILQSGRREPGGIDTTEKVGGVYPSASSPVSNLVVSKLNTGSSLESKEGNFFSSTSDNNLIAGTRNWSIEHDGKCADIYIRADEGMKEVYVILTNASTYFDHAIKISISGWIHRSTLGKPDSLSKMINPEEI